MRLLMNTIPKKRMALQTWDVSFNVFEIDQMKESEMHDDIDPKIRDLVCALNEIPGLDSNSSCEGHDTPDISQTKNWYVDFSVQPNKRGWAALDILAYAVNEYHIATDSDVRIEIWADVEPKTSLGLGFVRFYMEGSDQGDLEILPNFLRMATRAYYI